MAATLHDNFHQERHSGGEGGRRREGRILLLDYDCTEMWSRRLGEIVEFIALDVPELPDRPSPELIQR